MMADSGARGLMVDEKERNFVEYARRERPSIGVWMKAIMMSLATMYPLHAVVDELTHVSHKDFIPCSGTPCRYIKIFGSGNIPGTGADVIQVQNGMSRPIYMHDYTLEIHTSTYYRWKNNRSVHDYSHAQTGKSLHDHGQAYEHNHGHALDSDDDKFLHEEMVREKNDISYEMGFAYRFSFWTQKTMLRIFMCPFSFVSSTLFPDSFGKHMIVPAICPGLNTSQMQKKCDEPEIRDRIDDGSLRGHSRNAVYVGLVIWSLAKSVHDVLVVSSVSEEYTIMVGQFATFFQGLAVFSVFFWSMASFGVFGAMVPNEDCMCYYKMPLLGAVASLATPMVMLIYFFSKVQAVGMSILYGDYLYFATYDVPAYLVRQSKMWSWSTLVGPWLAGTPEYEQGHSATLQNRKQSRVKIRTLTSRGERADELIAYRKLAYAQSILILSRFAVWLMPVCMAASPIMFRSKELIVAYMQDVQGSSMALAVRCLLLSPLVFASLYPTYYVWALYSEILPEWLKVHRGRWFVHLLHCGGYFSERQVFYMILCFFGFVELTIGAALVYGLWPGSHVLFSHKMPWPTIADAELEGASGFVLIAVPLQQMFLEAFICREDKLKYEFACEHQSLCSQATHERHYNKVTPGQGERDDNVDDYDGFGLKVDAKGNTEFAPEARGLFEDIRLSANLRGRADKGRASTG